MSTSTELFITRFDFDQPALILCSLSTAVTIAVFIVSMLDLGVSSYYLCPVVSVLTLTFHISYFILRRLHRVHRTHQTLFVTRLPKTLPPGYSIGSIASACSLSFLWIAPLSATVRTACTQPSQSTITVLFAQMVLCAVNVFLLAAVAVISTSGRRDFFHSQQAGAPLNPVSL